MKKKIAIVVDEISEDMEGVVCRQAGGKISVAVNETTEIYLFPITTPRERIQGHSPFESVEIDAHVHKEHIPFLMELLMRIK